MTTTSLATTAVRLAEEEDDGNVLDKICDVVPVFQGCIAKNVVGGTKDVIDFATDPWGRLVQMLQDAASGMAETVLPALLDLTKPKFEADWFLSLYAVSFGLAFLILGFILLWNFYLLTRNRVTGDQVINSMVLGSQMFIVGAMFGPMFAVLIGGAIHKLIENIAYWSFTGSIEASTEPIAEASGKLAKIAETTGTGILQDSGDFAQITGGTFVSVLALFFMVIALIMILFILLAELIAMYFLGALVPAGAVWWASADQHDKGAKLFKIIGALMLTPIILFFALGIAFKISSGLGLQWDGKPGLQILVDVAVAIIALTFAALSPFLLMRLAPHVLPTSSPTGGGSGGGSGSNPAVGEQPGQGSQLSRLAQSQADSGTDNSSPAKGSGMGSGGDGSEGSPGKPGKVASMGNGLDGSSGADDGSSDHGTGGDTNGGPGGGKPAKTGAVGGESGGGVSALATEGAEAGSAGAAESSLGGAAAASGSTGVGLPVAVVLGTAAGGMKAASVTADLSKKAGDAAAAEVEREDM